MVALTLWLVLLHSKNLLSILRINAMPMTEKHDDNPRPPRPPPLAHYLQMHTTEYSDGQTIFSHILHMKLDTHRQAMDEVG